MQNICCTSHYSLGFKSFNGYYNREFLSIINKKYTAIISLINNGHCYFNQYREGKWKCMVITFNYGDLINALRVLSIALSTPSTIIITAYIIYSM